MYTFLFAGKDADVTCDKNTTADANVSCTGNEDVDADMKQIHNIKHLSSNLIFLMLVLCKLGSSVTLLSYFFQSSFRRSGENVTVTLLDIFKVVNSEA